MKLRRSKFVDPFDLWAESEKSKAISNRIHPSKKRTKKTPLPHPGQSYNPDPEQHEKLLKKVAKDELKYIKKKRALNKAFNVKVTKEELQKDEKEELESGIKHLLDPDEDKDSDGSETDHAFSDYDEKDFEAMTTDKAVKEKRKTRQQRMRQFKDKLQRKAAKLKKLKNIRLSRIEGVKKIVKELDNEATVSKKKSLKMRRERFCQMFEAPDPIYCLKSELPSELRKVSCPMDKIVREQLDSFKSRLMIEPTSYQTKKLKFKKRQFERMAAAEQEA